jgi:glycosyltransferase involved in cell wall biosynthesis
VKVHSSKVSICILCYNAEETISRALDSALDQDYPNKEIIVVDDASTDASLQILTKLQKEYDFRLIEHAHNKGPGSARNTAIEAATGEFVVFFDDDDVSTPQRASQQMNTIAAFETRLSTQQIACYASGVRSYPNGYNVSSTAIGSTAHTPPHGPDMAKYLLAYHRRKGWFYGAGTPTSALMIRKNLVQEIGGFDPNLRRVEDVDLAIRLALNGCYFVGSPEMLFERRMTDAQDKSPEHNFEAEQSLAIKYKTFLDEAGLFYHAHNWPKLRYRHFRGEYLLFAAQLIGLILHNPFKTINHLLATGPKRLIHETKMKR